MQKLFTPAPERPPAVILCAQIAGLALARRLGRQRIPVALLDSGRDAPGWASRYCTLSCQFSAGPEEQQVAELEAVAALLDERPALLATSDDTLLLVSRHRERLQRRYRLLLPPHRVLDELIDKRRMSALLAAHDIPVPETRSIETRADLRLAAIEIGFPCLLKSAGSKVNGRSSAGKVPVHTMSELEAAYTRMVQFEPRVMVQEFLDGDCDQVALYNAYFNRHSQPVAIFTGRKLRQYPVEFGTASLSECGPNPEIAAPLTRFFQSIGYCGPVDVGMKRDRRTGVFKVLDINPRLGQNYRTYVAPDGTDLGWLAYRELAGEELTCRPQLANPARGRLWAIEDNDWRSARELRRAGRLGRWGWLRSLFGVHEFAYWDWTDPQPFFTLLAGRGRMIRPSVPAATTAQPSSPESGNTYVESDR